MFSNNPTINRLAGTQGVDYFPGLCNPSWQLEHVTNANGWGDFWLYRSRFRDCLCGSHPWVTGMTEKLAEMYTVLKISQLSQSVKSSLMIPTCSSGHSKAKMQESGDSMGGRAIRLTVSQVKLPKEAIVEMSTLLRQRAWVQWWNQDEDPVIVGGVVFLAPGTHTGKSLS